MFQWVLTVLGVQEALSNPNLHVVRVGLRAQEGLRVPIVLVFQVDQDFLEDLEVQYRHGYQECHLDHSHHLHPFLLVGLEDQQVLAFHLVPALHSSHLLPVLQ